MEKWISVKDKLPAEGTTRVLVAISETKGLIGFPAFDTDRYFDGRWVRWDGYVTHWMPLPKPPEEVLYAE